tara:strand:- start:848 stop:1315 length:468 start_codon:yes stop_codon:yes gene_type:complete
MKPIQIKDCEHYSINEEGVVVNTESGRVLKTDLMKVGYKRITFWSKAQKRVRVTVHRLVAMHFIPNPEGKKMVNHKDGNKLNNHISNLEWCTCKENTRHAFDTGLRTGPNRLPDDVVRSIKKDRVLGLSSKELQKKYNLPKHRIDDINRYYKDIC